MRKFPFSVQLDQMDCGPACLKMVSQYYGKYFSLQLLREYCSITREGVSLNGIIEAAEKIGLKTFATKLTFEQLDEEAVLPCILHWNQRHFVVLPPQNYDGRKKKNKILIADPAHGMVRISKDVFLKAWKGENNTGVALMLEPTQFFNYNEEERKESRKLSFLLSYLKPYKRYVFQILLGMFIGSLLSLIFPFLTQALVDHGINEHNLNFVYLILFSQLSLFLGSTGIEVLRGWLLLHISTRINISIISDFLIKLMRLPIKFFDTKMVGDISQRIIDHNRIEEFLTGISLSTIFSLVNLIVFSVVLYIYSFSIFTIFLVGSLLSTFWIILFMKKRKDLDYARFQQMSSNQNTLFEMITGMQEIKMNDSEISHRWEWERIQARLFKISIKGLKLGQFQMIGSSFFSQFKNIIISFIAAKEVINGEITLGMMLSISYIIGQANSPIEQLLAFLRSAQDAKISLDRLNEIHKLDEEEKPGEITPANEFLFSDDGKGEINVNNLSFRYAGESSPLVLKNINLTIPFGKVTAIVGSSGSGKTTLMKLLLKFYDPSEGEIYLNSVPLNTLSSRWWRGNCGVVMSDGFIFSRTIERNISVKENIDKIKLVDAVKVANIEKYINELPLGYSTKIGNTGNGISMGQRQRILIARAVYKDPIFVFLDEPTNALDANNEKIIIENLNKFIEGRTVIIIAHRLSTVKHADQIIVLENGEVSEIGKHDLLVRKRGKYFDLVKNQLELEE